MTTEAGIQPSTDQLPNSQPSDPTACWWLEPHEHDWAYIYTQSRFRSFGKDLCQWTPDQFKKLVMEHVENCWESSCDKFLLIATAFMYFASAVLNVAYLSYDLWGFERDSSEDYNLTQIIVRVSELLFVVGMWIAIFNKVYYAVKKFRDSDIPNSSAGCNLIDAIFVFLMVRSFSMLWIIMAMDPVMIKGGFMGLWRLLKTLHREKYGIGYWCGFILLILLAVCFTAGLFFMGPAALLLKIRQISPVVETHVYGWDPVDWFQFAGFLNNLVGIVTVRAWGLTVDVLQRVLFLQRDVHEQKRESMGAPKKFTIREGQEVETMERLYPNILYLVTTCIWETKGLFAAIIIMISWRFDLTLVKHLMRGSSPPQEDWDFVKEKANIREMRQALFEKEMAQLEQRDKMKALSDEEIASAIVNTAE